MFRNFVNRKSQLFTASGTFTVPMGVSMVYLTGCAPGGGAGGAAYDGDGPAASGGGGGAGESCSRQPVAVTPGASITVTIGSRGTGGQLNTDGTDAGNVTFGALFTLHGGGKGYKGIIYDHFNAQQGNGGAPGGPSATAGRGGLTEGIGSRAMTPGGSTMFVAGIPQITSGAHYLGMYGTGGGGATASVGDDGGEGFLIVEWA